MELVFEIPNKIVFIKNFLDYKAYKQLHYDVFREKNIVFQTGSELWKGTKIYNLLERYQSDYSVAAINNDYKPIKKLKTLLNTNPYMKVPLNNTAMVNDWKEGSGSNWHCDTGREFGITYFLNRRWSEFWGGELMFKDEDKTGFIQPVANSVVIIKTPFVHKVSPVLKTHINRKTIQIFSNN